MHVTQKNRRTTRQARASFSTTWFRLAVNHPLYFVFSASVPCVCMLPCLCSSPSLCAFLSVSVSLLISLSLARSQPSLSPSQPSSLLLLSFFFCPAASGHDVLAKAKTGTGKTLSFLLPAIEGVARTPRAQRKGISVLIISPTRELAQQIADEANQVMVRTNSGGQLYVL